MYIKYKILSSFVVAAALFASCSEQDVIMKKVQPEGITFVSGLNKYAAPTTRVSEDGSQWTAGDKVGIFMWEQNDVKYSNAAYEAEASAATTRFKTVGDAMKYPKEGTAVRFTAYYPYSPAMADGDYPVNVANQSEGSSAHDLLFATADNEGKGFTKGSVSFVFKHQLAKIVLNLLDEKGQPIKADAGSVAVRGMNTTAGFNFNTGILGTAGTPTDIVPYHKESTAEAILLPFTVGSGHEVALKVKNNTYVWTMNKKFAGFEVKAGYVYTFNITVKTSATEVEAVLVNYEGNSITPWGDGGADSKKPDEGGEEGGEEVADFEIPADFEVVNVATGGSIKSAITGAATSKVAVVLENGGVYSESSRVDIPATISSLMIVGKGATRPSITFTSNFAFTGDIELFQVYNIEFQGVYASSYFLGQSAAVTINQFVIDNSVIHDVRGVVRLQSNASTIKSYKIVNSIIYHINNYNLLTVEASSIVENIELSKSTIYDLSSRGFYINAPGAPSTVVVDQCTFNMGPNYAVVQFNKDQASTLSFTNNIMGMPFNDTRGVSAVSNGSITESGNYYVSNTVWQGGAVGTDCGLTDVQLFADPANGNFKQNKLTAGDPRWY